MTKNFKTDKSWTLFLDRDGVINEKRENDYVKTWDEFVFINGSVSAITALTNLFGRIIVVTNQSCVGRGIVSEVELHSIHDKMVHEINLFGGRIDKIFFCPEESDRADCRKPNSGMAMKAKLFYPEIDFNKSIVIGDSLSDMLFGKITGMVRVFISANVCEHTSSEDIDFIFPSLLAFSHFLIESRGH